MSLPVESYRLSRIINLAPPKFTGNNGSHQIVINTLEKQNITLSCEAEGNPVPTIYWYKNSKCSFFQTKLSISRMLNLVSGKIDKLIATGPHLGIKDINRHSHSEYECVARNTIEPDPSRHFKINVNCTELALKIKLFSQFDLFHHFRSHFKSNQRSI